MTRAALYLSGRILVNSVRRRLARLRQPKYLAAFIVGALYYYWLIVRPNMRATGGGGGGRGLPSSAGEVIGILGVTALLATTWLLGSSKSPFAFTPAETHFLFTAPLTRRQVLDFKLLRSQLPLFISALLSVLLFSGGHFPATRIIRVLGVWLVFAALQLHGGVAALVRQSLEEHGVTAVRRRVGTFVVMAGIAAVAFVSLRAQLPAVQIAFADDPLVGFQTLAAALHRGALGVIVWPIAALVRPAVAADWASFAAGLPAALLVLGLHYVWLIRSSLAFEEVAVESAERMAQRIAAWRAGRRLPSARAKTATARRALTRLAPAGSPAFAIAWKNVQAEWRGSGVRLPVLMGIGLVVVAWVASMGNEAGTGLQVLASLSVALGGMLVVFGPYGLRNDLRSDLLLWDHLKTYPVSGTDLVAGEVLGPVVMLSAAAWACFVIGFLASLGRPIGGFSVLDRLAILAALCIAAPPFVALQTLIQNAAALFFPAWITLGPGRSAGIEMIGQRLLTVVASAVLQVIALIPAAVGAGLTVAAAGVAGVDGWWLVVPAAFGAALALAVEIRLALSWLGGVFDRSDPAKEIVG
jgi:ABC-2 type transport system permease protein